MPATVWKGHISFGLVSFPVHLLAAARPDPIHFHLLHKKDFSRLKEVFFCAKEDKPVTRDDMVKGYEYEKGKYVVIEPEELKKVAPATAVLMEIQEFVAAAEVDPLYFEKSYYVAPEEKLRHPYDLLLEAMRKAGRYAIAKISMHDREHIVILRPGAEGMVAHTMYFQNELHSASRPSSTRPKLNKKELDMAMKLVESLSATFKPGEYHDEYRKNVERLIASKRKGRELKAVPKLETKPVEDIMDALRQSLQAVGKATSKRKSKAA